MAPTRGLSPATPAPPAAEGTRRSRLAFAPQCAKQTPAPAPAPVAFGPAQGAPPLPAAVPTAGGCCQPQASETPAEHQRSRVARGLLPAPGRGHRRPRPSPRGCPQRGSEPRRVSQVSAGLRDTSAPGRCGQRGPGPGPARTRHCPAMKATVGLASPNTGQGWADDPGHGSARSREGTAGSAAGQGTSPTWRTERCPAPGTQPPRRFPSRLASRPRTHSPSPSWSPRSPRPAAVWTPGNPSPPLGLREKGRAALGARESYAAEERRRCHSHPQHGPDRGRPAVLRRKASPHRLLSPRPPRPARRGPALTARLTPPLTGRRWAPPRMRAARLANAHALSLAAI